MTRHRSPTLKVSIYKAIALGALFDVIWLFGIYPAMGDPNPSLMKVLVTMAGNQALSFLVAFLASRPWRVPEIHRPF